MSEQDLHVETSGEAGAPGVVLAHGFAGSARNFRPQLRALRDRYRVLLYDARGHARSPAPDVASEYRPGELVADLRRQARSLGEKVVVGGLSMGAGVALRYALAEPGSVRGLVLAAFPRTSAGDAAQTSWAAGFAQALDSSGVDAAGAQFVWGDRTKFDPKGAALIRQGFLEHQPHALAHLLRELIRVQPSIDDLAAQLAELDVPTLIIVGSEDEFSLAPSRRLAERLPHNRLVVVPGAGHVVNLSAPQAFNQALDEFLVSLPAPIASA